MYAINGEQIVVRPWVIVL